MAYTKAYTDKPIWHNDTDPAINETRLNDLCGAVDTIDDRVIEIDGKELQGISNVAVSDLQNNQGLKWDSVQQKWVNGVVGGSVDITYANYMALVNQDLDDPDILYNITDLNFTAGNIIPISYAEYQALTTAQKNDGTARFVYDYPLENTYLDDASTTSLTRGWSAYKLNNEFGTINTKLDKTTKEYFSHIHTFGNNLSNSDYKVTVPLPLADAKDGFMKVCVLFSHVQDLYGRYEEYSISTNNNSRYLTPIKTFEKTASTQYNDYTLTIGNDTKNVSFDLDFKITTGSALNHILKVVIYY